MLFLVVGYPGSISVSGSNLEELERRNSTSLTLMISSAILWINTIITGSEYLLDQNPESVYHQWITL
jgi:hypothetical protein